DYTTPTVIDLTPGAYSITSDAQRAYLGGGQFAHGTVYNAYLFEGDPRSYIENAIGGSGNDSICGNAIANRLDGRGGNDTLLGGLGNDILVGDLGSDVVYGGGDADTVVFAQAFSFYSITYGAAPGSIVVAGGASGTDTIFDVEYFRFSDGTRLATELFQ